jgi:hypothetical protein
MSRTAPSAAIAAMLLPAAMSQAVEVSDQGFETRTELNIQAAPQRVYEQLLGKVGAWWNPAHTWTGDAANLSIDARPGGCFCEKLAGTGAEHLRVTQLVPGKLVRLSGALGPLQSSGVAGSLSFNLSPAGDGTKLVVIYSVGGYWKGGFGGIAPAVESVITEQATRLKAFVETGKPAR